MNVANFWSYIYMPLNNSKGISLPLSGRTKVQPHSRSEAYIVGLDCAVVEVISILDEDFFSSLSAFIMHNYNNKECKCKYTNFQWISTFGPSVMIQ